MLGGFPLKTYAALMTNFYTDRFCWWNLRFLLIIFHQFPPRRLNTASVPPETNEVRVPDSSIFGRRSFVRLVAKTWIFQSSKQRLDISSEKHPVSLFYLLKNSWCSVPPILTLLDTSCYLGPFNKDVSLSWETILLHQQMIRTDP